MLGEDLRFVIKKWDNWMILEKSLSLNTLYSEFDRARYNSNLLYDRSNHIPILGEITQRGSSHDATDFISSLKEFKNRLESIDPIMIDSFLNDNPSLRDVGKLLIAYEILSKEKKFNKNTNFGVKNTKSNWYRYLLDAIISGCVKSSDLLKNQDNLKIVTFNYDVSLEYYLHSRLSSIERFEEEDVNKFLDQDLVTHVYGAIRNNPFESQDYQEKFAKAFDNDENINCKNYDPISYKNRLELAYEASKHLEVIDKEKFNNLKDESHILKAREYIKNAKKIFILGFGFYEDNMKILGLDERLNLYLSLYYTNYENHKRIESRRKKFMRNVRCKLFPSHGSVLEALEKDFDFI